MKAGLLLLSLCLAVAFAGPMISGYDYDAIDLASINLPPSMEHWFGTDDLGRDLFTRVALALRLSLAAGCSAALIDCFIGAVWGAGAAMLGGYPDTIMMRLVDILASIPHSILAIVLLVIMGPGFATLLLAMVIAGWLTMARLMRAHTLTLMSKEYILSARLLGGGFFHIMRRHILSNSMGIIATSLLLTVPHAIFLESLLSFLGLGVPPPTPSLGGMVQESLAALPYYPWRLLIPAAWISAAMLAFNLLGEYRGENEAFA